MLNCASTLAGGSKATSVNAARWMGPRGERVAMEQIGVVLGIGLLVLVSVSAFLLGRKAARSVDQFREEHHQSFVGKEKR